MKKFTVGAAAELTGLTAEALRHYDRIGVLSPHEKDEHTNYRYYTEDDIIGLKTVALLRCMDLPLPEIKSLLAQDDLHEVVRILEGGEARAREKIRHIEDAIARMGRARAQYEHLLAEEEPLPRGELCEKVLPPRTLFLSERESLPRLSDLWEYYRVFEPEIPEQSRSEYEFEDIAAVFCAADSGEKRLAALCRKFPENSHRLRALPGGKYLCRSCAAEEFEEGLAALREDFRERNLRFPAEYLAIVRVRGLLKWDYELQAVLP